MSWQRARTPENIEARKCAILDAARDLFSKKPYEDISLNGIAANAGFTKSNVYTYFSSREEIFLTVFSDLAMQWTEDLCRNYQSMTKEVGTETFAEVFASTTAKHKSFLDLSPYVYPSLEKNSSQEQVTDFKRLSLQIYSRHASELVRIFPGMTNEDVRTFLHLSHAIMANLWASAKPNKTITKIYSMQEFHNLTPDFEGQLKVAVIILIAGIQETRLSFSSTAAPR